MAEYEYRCPACGAVATFTERVGPMCYHADADPVGEDELPLVTWQTGEPSEEPPTKMKRVWSTPAIQVGNHGYDLP